MGKAIEDLRNEHHAILSSLQILDTVTRRLERGLDVQRRDIHDFIGFLKEFADKCHHGKEEGILFPALIKAGMQEKGGPISVMLSEHARGRDLIKEMDSTISAKENQAKFTNAAKGYSELLRAHIAKENDILFPSAEKALTETQQDRIFAAFEQHEEKVMGAGRHEELHAMLKNLKQSYAAGVAIPKSSLSQLSRGFSRELAIRCGLAPASLNRLCPCHPILRASVPSFRSGERCESTPRSCSGTDGRRTDRRSFRIRFGSLQPMEHFSHDPIFSES